MRRHPVLESARGSAESANKQAPRRTTIGIVQLCATADVAQNLAVTKDRSARCADDGAEVVFLPEGSCYVGSDAERVAHHEELVRGGPILDCCRQLATRHGVHVVAGGYPEDAGEGKAFNTCFHLTPDGELGSVYRKIHLFDVDLADGTRFQESLNTVAGSELATADLPFGRLGLSVCYDLRFPLLYQALVDLGAIALAVPAAFTHTTGRSHWHVLLRARAIECQSWVIAPGLWGEHGYANRRSYGHSLVADPWGRVVAEVKQEADGHAVACIDPASVHEMRSQLPSLANRGVWQ